MTKKDIVEKATELFLNLGFKCITMNNLALSMEVSKKIIYQHFKNKQELIKESSFTIFERITSEVKKVKEHSINPIEELHNLKMVVFKYLGDEKLHLTINYKSITPNKERRPIFWVYD